MKSLYCNKQELIMEIYNIDKDAQNYESIEKNFQRTFKELRNFFGVSDAYNIPVSKKETFINLMKALDNDEKAHKILRKVSKDKKMYDMVYYLSKDEFLYIIDFFCKNIEDLNESSFMAEQKESLKIYDMREEINSDLNDVIALAKNYISGSSRALLYNKITKEVKKLLIEFNREIKKDINVMVDDQISISAKCDAYFASCDIDRLIQIAVALLENKPDPFKRNNNENICIKQTLTNNNEEFEYARDIYYKIKNQEMRVLDIPEEHMVTYTYMAYIFNDQLVREYQEQQGT